MAWELKKVEEQRKMLSEAYFSGAQTMTDLCNTYNISRKTGYKWANRYLELGPDKGLQDLSRAPHNPNTIFSDELTSIAIDLKLKYRSWGPKKILVKLRYLYPKIKWPSETRLYEIFKSHHLVESRKLRKRVPATHPLGDLNKSNDVWMADFKGWFLTKNGQKCEPLTITDGYSRYLLKCEHMDKKTAHDVWPIFEAAFKEYGLPLRIRTDNGPPFGSVGIGRLTHLSVNFIRAGVMPEWINPGHPEENGRHERFHLTLKNAIANPPADNLQEQKIRMIGFQEEYNFERPHEALKMNTPATHYSKSTREWDGKLRAPEYDTTVMSTRKICPSGCIWIKQKEHYISKSLCGEYIGLKQIEGKIELYYDQIYLGSIEEEDLKIPKLVSKKRKD